MSPHRSAGSGTARRVAIVGGGPRATWALDHLAQLSCLPGAGLPDRIDVFSDTTPLGPGSIYAVDQPDWLRLNVASSGLPGFEEWLHLHGRHGSGADAERYPPRAVAGRWLADTARAALEGLPEGLVTLREGHVTGLNVSPTGVRLDLADASRTAAYDVVLIAVGHARDWPGRLDHGWPNDLAPVVPAFPVKRLIERARGADTVLVRGCALTGIDTALALSEGLGGHFDERYHAPTQQPGIVLSSRTGRPMAPKSTLAMLASVPTIHSAQMLVERWCPEESVPSFVCRVAAELLGDRDAIEALVGDFGMPDAEPLEWLRHRRDVAVGAAPIDATWALGQAWRMMQRPLTRWQDQCRPAPTLDWPREGWPAYLDWTRELERLSFGPPVVNATKLLALVDAGVLTVRAGDTAELARELTPDLVVDAVLAPPGVRDIDDPLWGSLVAAGLVEVTGRGVAIDPYARTSDPRLWVVGRATEDVSLGNDTLNRDLHRGPHDWARAVLGLPLLPLSPAEGSHD